MSFNCQILADSINPQGDRITTMKITFPRFILAEFNTHRMFSRNSASSRAIPFEKMVKSVQENPFIPIAWQKHHKGMQGNEYLTDEKEIEFAKNTWLEAKNQALKFAKVLSTGKYYLDNPRTGKSDDKVESDILIMDGNINVTKQLCNRLLEPFMWHTVIVTATEWENFFKLRCPQYELSGKIYRSKKEVYKETPNMDVDINDTLWWLNLNNSQAEIHIQAIAELMLDAYNESNPNILGAGEWHIPFGDNFDNQKLNELSLKRDGQVNEREFSGIKAKVKIATARCARISYETLGDNPKIDYEADIILHDTLVQNGHASPLEHCARAMSDIEYNKYWKSSEKNFRDKIDIIKVEGGWCNNFKGFIQYRHLVENNLTL
jgi:hypothetical protein